MNRMKASNFHEKNKLVNLFCLISWHISFNNFYTCIQTEVQKENPKARRLAARKRKKEKTLHALSKEKYKS